MSIADSSRRRQAGLTLVELIMFIVIVGVALAGVLLAMNKTIARSADSLIRKQSLAIAESLLEEIELMPFTFCDPDDPNAAIATAAVVGAGDCTAMVEGMGAEAAHPLYQPTAETRYSSNAAFDNVNDYQGFDTGTSGGVRDITNIVVAGLENYRAVVGVAAVDFAGIAQASGNALQITVTVTGPDNIPVVLEGYRLRYAPNAVP